MSVNKFYNYVIVSEYIVLLYFKIIIFLIYKKYLFLCIIVIMVLIDFEVIIDK